MAREVPIRVTHDTWLVQERTGEGQWTDVSDDARENPSTRFADAVRTYHACASEQKRLLRNGKALRIRTDPDTQLDLFQEE